MRKITLLMGLFLSLLGVAQVSAQDYRYSGFPISTQQELTSGRYLISVHSKGLEGLLYWSNSGTETSFSVSSTTASSKTSSTMTASGEDAKYMWDIVVDDEGNFTIQSVSSLYYTSKMGKDAEGKHNVLYVSAGDANIGKHQLQSSVTISSIPHFTVKLANGTFNGGGNATYFHCNGDNLGTTGNHMHLGYWEGENTSTASGNTCVKMAFYQLVPDLGTSTITYDYQMNEVSMKTEQHIVANGAAFPNLTLPAFCTGTKPEGTVSAGDHGTTKVINVTWNGPFNYSSTVGEAKWYLMTLAKAGTNLPVVRYNPEHQYITLEQGDNTFTYAKNDQWAFVGNPFDGFKIYNRALSDGRLISSTTMSGTTGKETLPYVSAAELPSGYTDTWDIHQQSWNTNANPAQIEIPGGFAISQHGTPANKMNRRAQGQDNNSDFRMAYWTGGSDNGSTFTVSQTSLPNITLNPVNGTSYASFFVDYPVVVTSDNVKVYTGTVNNNSLEMTEAGDKIIPANVGVVLISESGATTAEISISNNNGTLLSGDLTGTTTARNIDGSQSNYLVLGRDAEDNTKVGFYRPNGDEIPAYKAYIYLGGGSVQGLAFNFDGATTDINNISATTDKQEIYDLSGRRVMKANKGLYIINGKKCFIK